MIPLLRPQERKIMENEAKIRQILDERSCPDEEFAGLSDELLAWASEWIQSRRFSMCLEKGEELL